MQKTIKFIIDIEQDRTLGMNISGNFKVVDMLFSDISRNMDDKPMIKDVKYCIKSLKGFSMLTLRLTHDESYAPYPKEINSIRFVKEYDGTIKMAYISGTRYNVWEVVDEKAIYDHVKSFVNEANLLHKEAQ